MTSRNWIVRIFARRFSLSAATAGYFFKY